MSKKLYMISLGCSKNLVDSEVMLGLLEKDGYAVTQEPENANLLLVNTCGFIGSAVIRHIVANTEDSVVNVDKLTYAGNLESLADISSSKRYSFERVDICDQPELERVFHEHQPDAVMHLAAERHLL